jgi:hypothetical protein
MDSIAERVGRLAQKGSFVQEDSASKTLVHPQRPISALAAVWIEDATAITAGRAEAPAPHNRSASPQRVPVPMD